MFSKKEMKENFIQIYKYMRKRRKKKKKIEKDKRK